MHAAKPTTDPHPPTRWSSLWLKLRSHLEFNPRVNRELWLAGLLIAVCLGCFAGGQVLQTRFDRGNAADAELTITSERLLSALRDVETSQRGFLLTGDDAYLEPYRVALPRLEAALVTLNRLQVPLDGLPGLVEARVVSADAGVALRRRDGLAASVAGISRGRGKELMDTIRARIAMLQSDAQARIKVRDQEARHWYALLNVVSALCLAAAVAMVSLFAVRRRRDQNAGAELLQGVMENAPVGLGLLDGSLRVRHMNRALAAMGDRALGVDVGSSIWDVMPGLREPFAAKLQEVVAGGRGIPNTEVTAASTARPDQMREFQVSFYPLRGLGKHDHADGAGMVVTDVTTRKRLERRTRESESRLRTLTESSASIIWTTDTNGALNGEMQHWMRFTGQDAAAASGLGWLDAVHPDDRDSCLVAWERSVATGKPYVVEHRMRRADGAWRNMEVHAVPVLEEDGSIREWIGMDTDITERRLAETALAAAKEAAEAANRAKSTFLANMSHELRTPLSAVIGYSEMLEEEMEDLNEPHLVADLQKIKSNARHLLSLINDVLDLSKIEANRMTSFAEAFVVAEVAREAAATVDALVQRKANTLELDFGEGEGGGDDLGEMHSDVVKLRQCLFNLVSNAAKFTENGRITLKVRREPGPGGDRISFAVQDTGIGMSPEQLGRLFERFVQADDSTTRQFGGTGLGLALTRAFCRLLGGDVTVESEVGRGTCFTMRLPVEMPKRAAEPDAEPGVIQPIAPGEVGHDTVLVIDDDPAQRDLLTRFLERENFRVQTAADGRTGLEMARALRPRAILLDVMMPQMDGWSVLTALKAEPELAKIPVVMASFVNEPALAASLGASGYVLKPLEWDQLKSVMDRFRATEGAVLLVENDPDARARLRTVLEANGWTVSEAENGQQAIEIVTHAMPQVVLLDLTIPVMDGFVFLHALREQPGGGEVPVVVLSARDLDAHDRDELKDVAGIWRKDDVDLRELPQQLAALRQSGQVSGHMVSD